MANFQVLPVSADAAKLAKHTRIARIAFYVTQNEQCYFARPM